MKLSWPPGAPLHPAAAPATPRQARQQGGAMPYGANRPGTGAAGGYAGEMLVILGPGDGGRHMRF
jgi:hypothetical protein